MSPLTIGQVAERTGFRPSALRFYEDVGLLSPISRSKAGYRLYDDHSIERLAFIARAKQLGCSLREITDLVGIWDDERCGPVQRRFHELVTAKLHATQRRIAELIALSAQLQSVVTRLDEPPVDGPCSDDCACLAGTDRSSARPVEHAATAGSARPIACTLEADAVTDRIERWRAVLTHVRARTHTADGRLRLQFRPDVELSDLVGLVAAEHQCCTFFDFVITIDHRGVALEIDAPDEATEIVTAMFGTAA
jgi:DNA-binding transcriptional MerR regulator